MAPTLNEQRPTRIRMSRCGDSIVSEEGGYAAATPDVTVAVEPISCGSRKT